MDNELEKLIHAERELIDKVLADILNETLVDRICFIASLIGTQKPEWLASSRSLRRSKNGTETCI